MRDHAVDEHESLKLFTSDLEGMKLGDEGYDDKMHQLMEVGGLKFALQEIGQSKTCIRTHWVCHVVHSCQIHWGTFACASCDTKLTVCLCLLILSCCSASWNTFMRRSTG